MWLRPEERYAADVKRRLLVVAGIGVPHQVAALPLLLIAAEIQGAVDIGISDVMTACIGAFSFVTYPGFDHAIFRPGLRRKTHVHGKINVLAAIRLGEELAARNIRNAHTTAAADRPGRTITRGEDSVLTGAECPVADRAEDDRWPGAIARVIVYPQRHDLVAPPDGFAGTEKRTVSSGITDQPLCAAASPCVIGGFLCPADEHAIRVDAGNGGSGYPIVGKQLITHTPAGRKGIGGFDLRVVPHDIVTRLMQPNA